MCGRSRIVYNCRKVAALRNGEEFLDEYYRDYRVVLNLDLERDHIELFQVALINGQPSDRGCIGITFDRRGDLRRMTKMGERRGVVFDDDDEIGEKEVVASVADDLLQELQDHGQLAGTDERIVPDQRRTQPNGGVGANPPTDVEDRRR